MSHNQLVGITIYCHIKSHNYGSINISIKTVFSLHTITGSHLNLIQFYIEKYRASEVVSERSEYFPYTYCSFVLINIIDVRSRRRLATVAVSTVIYYIINFNYSVDVV